MPSEGKPYTKGKQSSLKTEAQREDDKAFLHFLEEREKAYRENAGNLYNQARRAYSQGDIPTSKQLLRESEEVARRSVEYNQQIMEMELKNSRDSRRQLQIAAADRASELEKTLKKEEGEPINNCTPVKIIREGINEMFSFLTGRKRFDKSGILLPLHVGEDKDNGIIGDLLDGFVKLQDDEKEAKLDDCKSKIKTSLKPYIDDIEDNLYIYIATLQPLSRSTSLFASSFKSAKSLLNRISGVTPSRSHSVTSNMPTKSGKSETNTTLNDRINTIISNLGYDNYFPDTWSEATTRKEVTTNFITFCDRLMEDMKNLYDFIHTLQPGCREVLHFTSSDKTPSSKKPSSKKPSSKKPIRTFSMKIGGKSRKRKPKRKTKKNKNNKYGSN